MNRPTITHEMKLAAAVKVAKNLEVDAEVIATAYRYPMDGYRLARELDDWHGCAITANDVEELDAMDVLVRKELENAEKQWVERECIAPKLSVGAVLKRGVVAGVCETSPARYLVKEHGCKDPGKFLLVCFEDAESEVGDGAMTD